MLGRADGHGEDAGPGVEAQLEERAALALDADASTTRATSTAGERWTESERGARLTSRTFSPIRA